MSTFTLDTLSTFANNAKIYLFIYFTYLFIGFLVLRTHLDVFKMVFYMLIVFSDSLCKYDLCLFPVHFLVRYKTQSLCDETSLTVT